MVAVRSPLLLQSTWRIVSGSPLINGITIIMFYSFLVLCYYYYYYYHLPFESFSHQSLVMVSNCSFSESKFPQVSRTLLSTVADLNNAVVWMVSTCPQISKSSSPFTNPLVSPSSSCSMFHDQHVGYCTKREGASCSVMVSKLA